MNSQNDEINTFWLRGPATDDGRGKPTTLIAYITSNEIVRFATATHCPPDIFSRKHAHNKAIGRLKSDRIAKTINIDWDIGPEATIARYISDCYNSFLTQNEPIDPNSPPQLILAARASVGILVERYLKRKALGRI